MGMTIEIEHSIEVTNKYGLHARASTRLAQIAQKFKSKILISREMSNGSGEAERSEEVDAKSILGILSLGAECGDQIRFRIHGDDAQTAIAELTELVQQKFDEE